jgi:hypothetical protein
MYLRHPILNSTERRQRRFGARRAKDPAARVGQGTAWLTYDAAHGCYHCYWLVGQANDHLVEHATEHSPAEAVEWSRSRTPRARIRLADHRTYWAGTDPAPPGFAGTWTPVSSPIVVRGRPVSVETRDRPVLARIA